MQPTDIPATSDYSILSMPLYGVSSIWTIAEVANRPEDSVVIALIKTIPAIFMAAAGVIQAIHVIRLKREKMAIEKELKLKELERRFPDPD
jgi:hypothetical protein